MDCAMPYYVRDFPGHAVSATLNGVALCGTVPAEWDGARCVVVELFRGVKYKKSSKWDNLGLSNEEDK